MNTDKVLALAMKANFSKAETWLYADRMGRFAALIQQQMEAENAELRKDAERYRWLKEQQRMAYGDTAVISWNIGHDWQRINSESLDEAIDRARSANDKG